MTVALFDGPGEARSRCRSIDWSATPLGDVHGWPPGLRSAVRLCMDSRGATAVWVGSEFILIHNDEYGRILGDRCPAAMGCAAREVWPELWETLRPEFEEVATGQATRHKEASYRRQREARDEAAYLQYSLTPIREEDGRVVGIFNVVEEVATVVSERAERAEREEQSRYAHSLLQSIAFGTEDMIAAADKDYRYLFFNDAYKREFRKLWARDLEVGTSMIEALAPFPEEQQKAKELWGRALAGESFRITMDFGSENQRNIYDLRFNPIVDEAGRSIGAAHILRDVTKQVRTQQALVAREQHLRIALDMSYTVAFEWDIRRNEVRRQHSRLGALPETLEERPSSLQEVSAAVHPDDRESFLANLDAALAQPERGYRAEYRLCEPGGRIVWLAEYGYLECDEQGQPRRLIGLSQDITERKLAEENLKAARDSAERARAAAEEASRAKDHFLAILAHELRNPLAPIRTGLDLVHALRGDAAACGEPIRIMDRQINHLVRLVDDLLDVSRISRGKIQLRKERLEIREIIDAALQMSDSRLSREDRRLSVSVPSKPLWVEGDRVRLVQVLANLLNNAVKFTATGGCIDLRVAPHGEQVEIQVQDDGRGIPSGRFDDIFEMFSQVEASGDSGLGIGLALVRGLVEMHGGTVWADSEGPGCGATFTVSLPLCQTATATPTSDKATEFAALQKQCRVLVVDDHQDIAQSLQLLLTILGAEVQVAHNGAEAIRICDDWSPTHVLMDLGMPGMDGFEAARRLRANHPRSALRLIAMTGWGQEEDRQRTREAGFDEHLVKPVRLEELKEVLSA
jgi:signal transduction histidine kinase